MSEALSYSSSEAVAAFALGGLLRVGFDAAGEMVVSSVLFGNRAEDRMYFAQGNNDPFAATADLTAGVRVAREEFFSWRLLDIPLTGVSNGSMWKLLQAFYADLKANGATDPLVLDLDGGGVNLIGQSSVSASFDINGTGFGFRTGWVAPGDGFLVVDRNGNRVTLTGLSAVSFDEVAADNDNPIADQRAA